MVFRPNDEISLKAQRSGIVQWIRTLALEPDWLTGLNAGSANTFCLIRLWESYLTFLCLSFLISKMQLKTTCFKELLWTLKELTYVKCLRYRLANRCHINVIYCYYYTAWLTRAECAEHAHMSISLLKWRQSSHLIAWLSLSRSHYHGNWSEKG